MQYDYRLRGAVLPVKHGKNPLKHRSTSWVPGQSGNPKGRPRKGDCIIEIARNMLQQKATLMDGTKFDMTWEQLLAQTWLEQSLKDPTLRKELHERMYGRLPLPVQGQVSGEITLRVVEE